MECWDAKNVHRNTRMAYLLFPKFHVRHCHLVAHPVFRVEVACQVEVPLVVEEARKFLSASSVSEDSVHCHFGIEGRRLFDDYKPLTGICLSQPSPFDEQETILPTSSPLGLQREVT
jgi:hypothetical protein